MWSIGLIVGVAVAASLTLLIAGVLLAIKLERRRYRKYIERHTAGTTGETRMSSDASTNGPGSVIDQPTSLHESVLRRSPETWMTLPSSETLQEHDLVTAKPLTITSETIEKTSLHKTLKGPVRKKPGGRKRLRKKAITNRILNPPLSAILENSDGSQSSHHHIQSQEVSLEVTSERNTNKDATSWELTILKKHESPATKSLTRANSTGRGGVTIRPVIFRRSISLTGSLAAVPVDPLPPLPAIGLTQPSRPIASAHLSHSSLESVGSSLLDSATTSPARSIRLVHKTQSQALQDFDFDLSSVCKARSQLNMTANAKGYERDGTQVLGRPKLISRLTQEETPPASPRLYSRLSTVSSVVGDIESSRAGLHGRGSISEPGKGPSLTQSAVPVLRPHHHGSDPFITTRSTQPSFEEDRTPLGELDPQKVSQRDSTCSVGSNRGHKRQNCVRIANLPLSPPSSYPSKHLQTSDPKKGSLRFELPIREAKRFASELNPKKEERNSPSIRGSSSVYSLKHSESLRSRPDLMNQTPNATLGTPDSSRTQPWRFDLIPPDTPSTMNTASPFRSYNSPVLPPPISTATSIFPYTRRSQVRGPRSPRGPRGQPVSPWRPKMKQSYHSVEDIPRLNVKKHNTPVAVHKSIAMLRHVDSDNNLLVSQSESHEKENQKPDRSPSFLVPSVPQSQPRWSTSTTSTFLPIPTRSLNRNRSVSTAFSAASDTVTEVSIWEDIPLREDSFTPSPDPESRPLSPICETGLSSPVEGSSHPRGHELRLSTNKPIGELNPDRYTNSTDAGVARGMKTPDRQMSKHLKMNSETIVGLGLRMSREDGVFGPAVSDTPRSMYDESGFLKESPRRGI